MDDISAKNSGPLATLSSVSLTKNECIWTDFSVELGQKPECTKDLNVCDSGTVVTLTRSTSLTDVEDNIKGSWCVPKWVSIKTFTAIICVLQFVNSLLVMGYTLAVLTTIEQQFHIDSTTSGFIITSYKIGSILSVVFVSYFGSHGHIPRWIGLGGMLLAIGSFLFVLPQALIHITLNNFNNTATDQICHLSVSINVDVGIERSGLDIMSSDVPETLGSDDQSKVNYVFVLVIAQILLGIGGSPLLTLGTVYIDNNAGKSNSAPYLAFMYIMMAIGSVCGLLLGGMFLQLYVDPFKTPPGINASNPDFVGLWWGGFFLCGILYILSSIPFLFFPHTVREMKQILPDKQISYSQCWKKIPLSIYRLVNNSVYMLTTINVSIVMTCISGYSTFLPKYIETQFNLLPSEASSLTGLVTVPGICFGIFFGGWIIKHLKLEMNGISILVLIVNIICGALFMLFFVFGCNNPPIAGLTVTYNSNASRVINPTDPCNSMCTNNCTLEDYDPICIGSMTYISPCFAGCVKFNLSENGETYDGICNCGDTKLVSNITKGICSVDCHMLIPFLILLAILCLTACNNQMPSVLITLRSVAEEEKAIALGVQVVVLLLSNLPAPVIYGHIIDSSCMVWSNPPDNEGRSCLLYDNKTFRHYFLGVSAGFMAATIICTLILWWCIRRRFLQLAPVEKIIPQVSWTNASFSMTTSVPDFGIYEQKRRASYQIHQKTRSC